MRPGREERATGQGRSGTQLQQHPTVLLTRPKLLGSPTTSHALFLLPFGKEKPQPDSQEIHTLMPSASRLRSMFCNKKTLKTKQVPAMRAVDTSLSPRADAVVPAQHVRVGTHHWSPRVSTGSRVARSPLGLQGKRE